MQITREELNPCTIKLTVTCDPDEIADGFTKAVKQIGKSIKLPGFRPGHAPRAMLESLIPKEELEETAAEAIVRSTYPKALEKEALQPDDSVRPAVEIKSLDRGKPEVVYTAKVPLPAQVTLGAYKGLPVNRPKVEVSEEEIDRQIDDMRERRSIRETVTDRGVQPGDAAVLSVRLEGDSEEGRLMMVVAGQSFPALDDALLGMKVEDIKNVHLTFPEDYEQPALAGKSSDAQITLNSLNAVRLPELDDSFAKSLRTESVEDLRERVRIALINAKLQMIKEVVNEQLMERLHERSTVHVSDNMWESLAEQRLRETAYAQAQEGKSLEQYAEENGMTLDQLTQAWLEKSKLYIERALLIKEIFVREHMQLNNEEVGLQLQAMAEEYEVSVEELIARLKKERAGDELQFRAISAKVANFLDANAVEATEDPAADSTEEPTPPAETE